MKKLPGLGSLGAAALMLVFSGGCTRNVGTTSMHPDEIPRTVAASPAAYETVHVQSQAYATPTGAPQANGYAIPGEAPADPQAQTQANVENPPDVVGTETLSDGTQVKVVTYVHTYPEAIETYPRVWWSDRWYYNVNGNFVYYSPFYNNWVYYWGPPAPLVYCWNYYYPWVPYSYGYGYYGHGWYWGGVGYWGYHYWGVPPAYYYDRYPYDPVRNTTPSNGGPTGAGRNTMNASMGGPTGGGGFGDKLSRPNANGMSPGSGRPNGLAAAPGSGLGPGGSAAAAGPRGISAGGQPPASGLGPGGGAAGGPRGFAAPGGQPGAEGMSSRATGLSAGGTRTVTGASASYPSLPMQGTARPSTAGGRGYTAPGATGGTLTAGGSRPEGGMGATYRPTYTAPGSGGDSRGTLSSGGSRPGGAGPSSMASSRPTYVPSSSGFSGSRGTGGSFSGGGSRGDWSGGSGSFSGGGSRGGFGGGSGSFSGGGGSRGGFGGGGGGFSGGGGGFSGGGRGGGGGGGFGGGGGGGGRGGGGGFGGGGGRGR